MTLRLIEMFLPTIAESRVHEVFDEYPVLDIWEDVVSRNKMNVKILTTSEETQKILDLLEKEFSMIDGFRVIILPVEAIIPRQEYAEKDTKQPGETKSESGMKLESIIPSISRRIV